METKISVKAKKKFMEWLLKNYYFNNRECIWILNYLMNDSKLLDKVHFVDGGVQYCPRGIFMSTADVEDSIPFCYFKENYRNEDPEKCFHDIRFNKDKELYIYVNSTGKHKPEYLEVLEVNEFVPEEMRPESKFGVETDKLLAKLLMEGELSRLEGKIDVCLENGDKETFLTLSKEYNELSALYKMKYYPPQH